jgi:hypothetical protein
MSSSVMAFLTFGTFFSSINSFSILSILNFINNIIDIKEQLLKSVGYLSLDKITQIAKFIKNHPKYYYNLDEIHKELKTDKIIDCSGSIFLSKCHLTFMENYISMISFINDFRKSI